MYCLLILKPLYVYLHFSTGRRKIHYTFGDGQEMAEEYDIRSAELIGKNLKILNVFSFTYCLVISPI